MKVVIQRVTSANIIVAKQEVARIDSGLVALCGFGANDSTQVLEPALQKILNMRIFANDAGRFHFSLLDKSLELLLVPQFTLYADSSKGRRPEFFSALAPEKAQKLFKQLLELATELHPGLVKAGIFGAEMKLSLCNDGPVTIPLEI